jgi:hypothetical protein
VGWKASHANSWEIPTGALAEKWMFAVDKTQPGSWEPSCFVFSPQSVPLHSQSSNSHVEYLMKNRLNMYGKARTSYINGTFVINNKFI